MISLNFISFNASVGVSIRLEMYIKGDARVLTIVMFPFMDRDLRFQLLSELCSVAIFGWKLYLKFSLGLLVM